jgi:transcriptional regulator GlxA family with amidase domain
MLVVRGYAQLSIEQIARESGIGDICCFNRVIRRHFGATPSRFP